MEAKSNTAVNYLEWEKGYRYARFGSDAREASSENSALPRSAECGSKVLENDSNLDNDVNSVFPADADNTR